MQSWGGLVFLVRCVECAVNVRLWIVGLEHDPSTEVLAPVPASATTEGISDIVGPAVIVNVDRFSFDVLGWFPVCVITIILAY